MEPTRHVHVARCIDGNALSLIGMARSEAAGPEEIAAAVKFRRVAVPVALTGERECSHAGVKISRAVEEASEEDVAGCVQCQTLVEVLVLHPEAAGPDDVAGGVP